MDTRARARAHRAVRPATPGDAPAIASIETHNFAGRAQVQAWASMLHVARAAASPQTILVATARDGTVVGYAAADGMRIRSVAVATSHGGRGLGGALVREICTTLWRKFPRGASRASTAAAAVTLEVQQSTGVERFYERLGFERTHEIEADYFGRGDDMILMQRVPPA